MKPFLFTSLELPRSGKSAVAERDGPIFPSQAFDPPHSAGGKAAEAVYSAKDLASAVEEARQATALEVEARTRAALTTELSHRQADALEAIRDQLSASEAAFGKRIADAAQMAQVLATMMGHAIVPKALEEHPLADIDEMLRQSLLNLVDQPAVELRLESELVDQIADLLKSIADETGFQGELTVVADPKLSAGEAKLVWDSGTADRHLGRIQEEVDLLVDAWLGHDPGGHSRGQADALPEHSGIEPGPSEEGAIS